jgi:hypothetical protein
MPAVDANYGAVENVQLHLQAPLAYAQWGGESKQFGAGDTEIGGQISLSSSRTRWEMSHLSCSQLRSNRLLVDIFLLGIMDTHERFNPFNDTLGVPDQIMVRILSSEAISKPSQKPRHMYNLAVRSAHCA